MAARTAGIDKNEEITSLPPYVYWDSRCCRQKLSFGSYFIF